MKLIPGLIDASHTVVRTVDHRLDDGRMVRLREDDVGEFGLAEALRRAGFGPADERGRVPVLQDGHMVGTLPAAFDPTAIRSRSDLYTPRAGDFRRDGNRWIAGTGLGQGDLDAVIGFQRA